MTNFEKFTQSPESLYEFLVSHRYGALCWRCAELAKDKDTSEMCEIDEPRYIKCKRGFAKWLRQEYVPKLGEQTNLFEESEDESE